MRGPNVMLGYWDRAEETNSLLDGNGWYRTGDAGYVHPHTYLYLVDRLKDMTISGGENVYSIEFENVIAAHPQVQEIAVMGVPDEKWGSRFTRSL